MYVAKSFAMEDMILVNNSAILYHPLTCSDCVVEFYCLSNSTLRNVGEVVLPDGTITHSSYMQPSVERLPFSTLRVELSNSHPVTGIFTCRLPDTNGLILETSIGLYDSAIGKYIHKNLPHCQ